MPKTAFSTSAFRAASPGLSKLALAIGGSGDAYNQGRNNEIFLQSKIAQQIADQQFKNAKAAEIEDARARGNPDAVRRNVLTGYGIPLNEDSAVVNYLNTGSLGGKYERPADDMGPSLAAPEWSKNLGGVARAIMATNNALALGDKNSENVATATGKFRDQSLSDAIIAGTADRNKVGGAQAAAAGKDLFNADSTGSVLDKFTGNLDTENPMAGATINLRKEQAGAQKANAAQSYASAGASKALAEQRKAVTAAGGTGGKVPVGYRYISGEDGEIRLEPIPGGPKDPNAQTGKPLPASASKGYLDNIQNLARAEKALALVSGESVGDVKGDKNATGVKGVLPMQVLNRVDPTGTETRAALADLGSLVIHDRSGAAVTAAEFPRLAPFIPTVYDDAATARKKLGLFVQNYKALVDDSTEFYKASGYNVPTIKPSLTSPKSGADAGVQSIKNDAEYDALPSGSLFTGPDGRQRRKP